MNGKSDSTPPTVALYVPPVIVPSDMVRADSNVAVIVMSDDVLMVRDVQLSQVNVSLPTVYWILDSL